MHSPRPLTNREQAYLARHYGPDAPQRQTVGQIARALGRTPEQIRDLARRRLRSDEERNALVEQNLGLAGWAANRFLRGRSSRTLARYGYDEAFADAVLGLLRAAELFDEARRCRFTTFASHWCWQAMQRGFHAANLIHHPERQQRSGESLPVAIARGGPRTNLSNDPEAPGCDPVEAVVLAEMEAKLAGAMRHLTRRERDVLTQRDLGVPLHAIGEAWGVSKERIRQIEICARRTVREAWGEREEAG